MAGGMRRGRVGIPLAQRVRADRPTGPAPGSGGASRRHCWVEPGQPGGQPRPGLLAAWDRRADGWYAYVLYVTEDPPAVVQEWLPATRVRPAGEQAS